MGGSVIGLLLSIDILARPLSTVMSVQVFGLFGPGLSNRESFVRDSQAQRNKVAISLLLTYCFRFASLLTLPLLPRQKADAQRRKKKWGGRNFYAITSVSLL